MKTQTRLQSRYHSLKCSETNTSYPIDQLNTYSSSGKPLIAGYSFDGPLYFDSPELPNSMWKYFEVLPILSPKNIVTLGEGNTPVIKLDRLGKKYGLSQLFLKDEAGNPTGSFKARGLSAAVSKAKELGVKKCILPTAGNAGSATSAYCARAGIQATVVMPSHTPDLIKEDCRRYGAEVIEVGGLISDCAQKVREMNTGGDYFDLSTLKEPFRLEGKKTMGYEIAEQFHYELPDVILYPTGGGTGLIGIWKAFQEMIRMGTLTGDRLPKMVAVQSSACNPVVHRFNQTIDKNIQSSVAYGLAVPRSFGEDLIMYTLQQSGGFALEVEENHIRQGSDELAQTEGVLVSPEGGSLVRALPLMIQKGWMKPDEKVLLINTGSGYKYY